MALKEASKSSSKAVPHVRLFLLRAGIAFPHILFGPQDRLPAKCSQSDVRGETRPRHFCNTLCSHFARDLKSNGFLVSYMCDQEKDLDDIFGDLSSTILIQLFSFLLYALGWEWEVQLGQYSLVEDFDRSPGLKQRLTARLMGRRRPHHQRGTITLPVLGPPSTSDMSWHLDQPRSWIVSKAVSSELKRFAFHGPSLLRVSSSQDGLSWSLRQETTIHTILIWHIETWFCAMAAAEHTKFLMLQRIFPSEYTFATMLSNYCAYLVAFRPELLPEHHALTASIFDEAVRQTELNLIRDTSPDERYTKMKPFYWKSSCSDKDFLKKGIELGEQLMLYSGSERWKVMAEFWAEMTMFVAQSGNADAHKEHLARGGELVTQLWAFQSNGWDKTFIRRNNDDDDMNSWSAFGDEARLIMGRMIDIMDSHGLKMSWQQ